MTIDKSRIQIRLPEDVKLIIDTLNKAGYEAYIVGGCVRDSILGRNPKDWDITTSAKPLEVKKLFRRTVDTGIQHGTVTVLVGNEGYEVTTYRLDSEYEDMRHPKEVEFTESLVEDLKRRDFTINAMAYSDETGLIDEFDGLSCIENRIIKAVGNAYDRMTEDALRILRALRFSAVLGYEIDDELKSAIRELSGNLSYISAERIREELVKLLMSDNPEKIREAYELGATKVVLPEFDLCMQTEQNSLHHIYSVGEHTIHVIKNLREYKEQFSEREYRILVLAGLFHDFGKPKAKTTDEATGRDHFTYHPVYSEQIAISVMKRLKFENDAIDNVKVLVRWHDFRPKLTFPKVRRMMISVGPDRMAMFMKLRYSDTLAQSDYEREQKLSYLDELDNKYKKVIEDGDCLSLKNLALNGKDLIDMGIASGPRLGEVLNTLLDYVTDLPSRNTRESLMEYVTKLQAEE